NSLGRGESLYPRVNTRGGASTPETVRHPHPQRLDLSLSNEPSLPLQQGWSGRTVRTVLTNGSAGRPFTTSSEGGPGAGLRPGPVEPPPGSLAGQGVRPVAAQDRTDPPFAEDRVGRRPADQRVV